MPGLSAGPPYVRVHPPEASEVAVPMTPAPTRVTLTELPASAVPVKTSEPVSAMSAIKGAAGGMRSIVTRNGGVVCGPVWLPALVAVAVKSVAPLDSDAPV